MRSKPALKSWNINKLVSDVTAMVKRLPVECSMLNTILRRLGLIRSANSTPDQLIVTKTNADDLSDIPSLVQTGHVAAAEARLRDCLARSPAHVDALQYLGLICLQSGRQAEAVQHISEAARLVPETAFLHANLAEALRAVGDIAGAERAVREALRLNPAQPAAQFNLAVILSTRHAHAEALEFALRALAANPEWPQALTLAANLYITLDQRAKAQALLDKAYALQPDDPATLVTALRNRAWLCDWTADNRPGHGNPAPFIAMLERWAAHPRNADFASLNPFVAYEYPVPQALRDAVTQAYADGVVDVVPADKLPPPYPASGGGNSNAQAAGRLRIGYVSADFHRHPTMHLMRSLFALHDRSRFEVFAYSMGPDDGSDYRREAVATVDHFIDIQHASPQQSAQRIRDDGIDILVDLKGYTHEARPEIFALRPAPLRVAWLGYPASTGRGLCDYAIVDRVAAPSEQQAHWGEQFVWMPHSYQVNDHRQAIASATPERSALGLPESGFVFACFNHLYKIEPRMFAVWMRILARVPGSVLWLYESNATARDNLRHEATARGIDAERLVFGPTLAKAEHLARLRQADLVLDTLWINAHTGASDALWAGVPVLTCPQDSFASRVAASLVTAAGLPQLVCATLEDYEAMAIRLASQSGYGELHAMRKHLETQHEHLPLFDTPRFVRNLERAFEAMWQRHLDGAKPAPFGMVDPQQGADRSGTAASAEH